MQAKRLKSFRSSEESAYLSMIFLIISAEMGSFLEKKNSLLGLAASNKQWQIALSKGLLMIPRIKE